LNNNICKYNNDTIICHDNNKNNILINIINPNFNKINNFNYNNCNHNKLILNNVNNYNNIINYYHNGNNILNPNKCNNNIKYYNQLNNININNLENNYNINNNTNSTNYLTIIKNNLMEKNNNLNNKMFMNKNKKNNNNKKKYINADYHNNNKNSNQQIDLNEFLKFINSLSMPLVDCLCTSKGILEIKKKLYKSDYDFRQFIILHLNKDGLTKIMKNVYGNYFFQQLIKNSEEQFISLILSYISDNFIEISKDPSGTFSLQALLDQVSTLENEQKILKVLKNHEMEMAFDKNATHVLQKLILIFPDTHRKELNEIILQNIKELCLDSNGICLIKNFIRTNTIENDKIKINNEFIKNFIDFAESPFGNYGIQYLIENWENNMLNDIKNKIMENLYKLSMQQYSSNVVEKAIEIIDGEYREKIIQELCFKGYLTTLLKNKFGRFVLYKAINYMNKREKIDLENELINNINNNIYNNKDKNIVKKFLIKIKHN